MPQQGTLRVLSLNIAHGRRLARQQLLVPRDRFHANLSEVAEVLAREAPDVVALQEADGPSFWSGGFDHVEHLAELAGYPERFRGEHNRVRLRGREVRTGTALLARLPLAERLSRPFAPSPPTPRKGFVVATVPITGDGGLCVDVVSVHLDFLRKAARRRQVAELARELKGRGRPLIVMGDMNCWWGRRNDALPLLVEKLGVRPWEPTLRDHATFSSRRPRFRIDWVLVSPELEFVRYETLRDTVSDHLGIVAEVKVATAA